MGKKKAKSYAKKSQSYNSNGKKTSSAFAHQQSALGPIRGLINIGNTCFFNACLQALNSVISYENLVVEEERNQIPYFRNGKVFSQLISALQSLQTTETRPSAYNPGMLLNEIGKYSPHFKNRRQHDSHELLISLLSLLSDEVVEYVVTKADNSHSDCNKNDGDINVDSGSLNKLGMNSHYHHDPVLSLFAGKHGSIVECLQCHTRSCSLQNCLDMSLQIPGSKHLMVLSTRPNVTAKGKKQNQNIKSSSTAIDKGKSTTNGYSKFSVLDDDEEEIDSSPSVISQDLLSSLEATEGESQQEEDTSFMIKSLVEDMVSNVSSLCHSGSSSSSSSECVEREDDDDVEMDFSSLSINDKETNQEVDSEAIAEDIDIILRAGQSNRRKECGLDNKGTKKDEISLYSCLDDFITPEELLQAEGNGYICPQCSGSSSDTVSSGKSVEKRNALKRLIIVEAPKVLIIHLKRLLPGGKFSKYVSFPLHLSMGDYMGVIVRKSGSGSGLGSNASTACVDNDNNNECNNYDKDDDHDESDTLFSYELNAVVVHEGGALGGHYISFVKVKGLWYYTSDTTTRSATETEVLKSEAYMLFYNKLVSEKEENKTIETEQDINTEDNMNTNMTDTLIENSFQNESFPNCEEKISDFSVSNIMCTNKYAVAELPLKENMINTYSNNNTSNTAHHNLTSEGKVDQRWAKSLKTAELKSELHARNLSTQGSKKDLLQRLLNS